MTHHSRPRRRKRNRTSINVIADYHRTPYGTWTAEIDAFFSHNNPDDGLTADAVGPTLKTCQDHVMEYISELSNTYNAPCMTLHTIDNDPTKFVEAYTAEVGFQGWSKSSTDNTQFTGPNGEFLHLK